MVLIPLILHPVAFENVIVFQHRTTLTISAASTRETHFFCWAFYLFFLLSIFHCSPYTSSCFPQFSGNPCQYAAEAGNSTDSWAWAVLLWGSRLYRLQWSKLSANVCPRCPAHVCFSSNHHLQGKITLMYVCFQSYLSTFARTNIRESPAIGNSETLNFSWTNVKKCASTIRSSPLDEVLCTALMKSVEPITSRGLQVGPLWSEQHKGVCLAVQTIIKRFSHQLGVALMSD